ncbi:hypothetical protein B0T20DRAFT_149239 [Sordaria brevicollis]|uniref:Myb transcription factor n=1 Tax=Sordaria brevicollis TaxID=83679 RepID=A0AAE0UE02_SORBR|nr:hypothetical protein B0T20DRAFT_149239 [Sordaria brevicollis]
MGSQQSVPEGEDGDVRSRSASPLVQQDSHWGSYENHDRYDDTIPDVPFGQQFDDEEQQPQSPVAPPSGERKKKKKKKSKHRHRSPSPAAVVEHEVNGYYTHDQEPSFADPEPAIATEEQHELPEAGKKKKKKKKKSKPQFEPQVEEEEVQQPEPEPEQQLPVVVSPNLKFERPEVAEAEPQSAAAEGSAKFKKKKSRKSKKKVTVDISDDPISDGEDHVERERTTKIHRGEPPSAERHVKRRRLSPEPVAEEEDDYDHGELDASFVKREPGADDHEPSMVGRHEHTSPLVARERRRARSASQHPVEVASSASLAPQFATQQSFSFHDESFHSTRIPDTIQPMDLDDRIDGLPNTQDFADGLPPSSQGQFEAFVHSSHSPRIDGLPATNSSFWEDPMQHDVVDEPEEDMPDAHMAEPDQADIETASSAGDSEPEQINIDQEVPDSKESSPEVDVAAEAEDVEDAAPEVSVSQTPAPKARKSRSKKSQAQTDAEPEDVEQVEATTPAPASTTKTPRSKGSKRKVKVPYYEREEASEAPEQPEASAEPAVEEVAATQKEKKREKKRKARAEEDEQSADDIEPAPKKAKATTKKKKPAKKEDSEEDNSEYEEADEASNMAKPKGRMTQAEAARIKKAIDSFREANGLSKHAVNDMIHQDPRKEAKYRELWDLIVNACPSRPRRKLVQYCRQNFHNFAARGSWTKEQDEQLESMLKIHGQKWTLIGGLINRFPDDVRDRYRNYLACGGKNRKDYWSEEEEERFVKVVSEAIDKIKASQAKDKNKSNDSPESLINWQQISTAMNHTRSRLQCLQKWKTLRKKEALPDSIMVKLPDGDSSRLDKARKDLRKITPEDKALLARAIRDSGAERERDIKWKDIKTDVFDKRYAEKALTVTWGRLRQAVPNWDSKSTQECAKYLCDMYERDADWNGDEEVGDDDEEDDADAKSTVSRPASVVVSNTQQTKIYRTPRVGLWEVPTETKTNPSHVFQSSDNEMRGRSQRTKERAKERAKRVTKPVKEVVNAAVKAAPKSKEPQLSEDFIHDEDTTDEEEVEESINGDIPAVNGNGNHDLDMIDAPPLDSEEDEESEPAPSPPVVRSRAVSVELGEPSFISSPQLPTSAQKRQDSSDSEDDSILATTSKAAVLKSKKASLRTYGKSASTKKTKPKRKEKEVDLTVPLVLGAAVPIPSLPPPSNVSTASHHPQLSPKRPSTRHASVNESHDSDHSDAAPSHSQLDKKKRRILTRQPSVRTTETIIKTTASVAKASKRRAKLTPEEANSSPEVASAVPNHLLDELVELDGNLADDSLVSLDRPGDVVGGVQKERKVAKKAKAVRKKLAASASASAAAQAQALNGESGGSGSVDGSTSRVSVTPAPLVKVRAFPVVFESPEVPEVPEVAKAPEVAYSVISSDMDDMEDIPARLPGVNVNGSALA